MKQSEICVIPVPKRIDDAGQTVVIKPHISCDIQEWKDLIHITKKAFEKILTHP